MELKRIIEALLFASPKALGAADLREILAAAAEAAEEGEEAARQFRKVKSAEIEGVLMALAREHEEAQRSYRLICVSGAWQFATSPDYAPWLRVMAGDRARPPRLSQPALETLAIVAYRQPLTRAEIEQIRGVSVDGVMQTLTERGLIEAQGRAEAAGRPMTYGTTAAFLEYFGLRALEDLPAADELRRISVEKPADLVTAESGLATHPPEQLTLDQVEQAGAPAAAGEPLGAETASESGAAKGSER